MKRILITGKDSYIGTSFDNWMKQYDGYQIDTIDMIGDSWAEKDFSNYDTVFHVAGIAHSDTRHVNDDEKNKYYRINTALTIETAKKAKADGVKQFIFMSSAIVYGESAAIGKSKIITKDTQASPVNFYGDSKLQAELGLQQLEDEEFRVVILRPPMIYGKGSKGNYPILSKIATVSPVFPHVNNQRSMLYVDNLAEFVKLIIDNEEHGIFCPQNAEYTNTSEMVKMIAEAKGRKIWIVYGFSWALKILSHFISTVNKAFGSMCYDQTMSVYKAEYRIFDLRKSIYITETETEK